ncbi:hypothetical protein L596_028281 [Steinernema carpocapsae]|uniref:Uncharacterized protein n=1 Tax=Steinernema carpocapsae TaxID=34508 RepID=A0A4U5LXY5_STECR|nr:hypothetical protein L596_028281 [Steinernema carpocapsae]
MFQREPMSVSRIPVFDGARIRRRPANDPNISISTENDVVEPKDANQLFVELKTAKEKIEYLKRKLDEKSEEMEAAQLKVFERDGMIAEKDQRIARIMCRVEEAINMAETYRIQAEFYRSQLDMCSNMTAKTLSAHAVTASSNTWYSYAEETQNATLAASRRSSAAKRDHEMMDESEYEMANETSGWLKDYEARNTSPKIMKLDCTMDSIDYTQTTRTSSFGSSSVVGTLSPFRSDDLEDLEIAAAELSIRTDLPMVTPKHRRRALLVQKEVIDI